MKKPKWKLVASHGSLDDLLRFINEKYYYRKVPLILYEILPGQNWALQDQETKKLIYDCRIIKSKNRYRFEMYI